MSRFRRTVLALPLLATSTAIVVQRASADDAHREAEIEVFAPHSGDIAGVGGRGWFVDLAVEFEDSTLAGTGAGLQITGPALHNNTAPLPGTFGLGKDDRLPGLVVLVSTTTVGARAGQNVANLFNLTGVTNRDGGDVEVWDTWIVGAPNFGVGESTLRVAVVDDLDGNGVLDDAPAVVTDADGDGDVDADDLEEVGLASEVVEVDFVINGNG